MNLALVSDAWTPQVNGVVRSLAAVRREIEMLGHRVEVIAPDRFRTIGCPTYPEIRLALAPPRRLGREIEAAGPDAVHIATEGPLGHAARAWCLRHGVAFTTAFHTRFPDYLAARFRIPAGWSWSALRRFHAASRAVMVATPTLERDLAARRFRNLRLWSRGVDTTLFRPRDKSFLDLERPVFLTVGRLAVEKNLSAFLDLDLPGSKVVVGDGPLLEELRRRHEKVHFVGRQTGEALARHYAAADVFVFPSRTDTFGLVLLEALACGVPVAAFPVAGPLDIVGDSGAGRLDEDLRRAALAALAVPPSLCRAHAERFSWADSAQQFLQNLCPLR